MAESGLHAHRNLQDKIGIWNLLGKKASEATFVQYIELVQVHSCCLLRYNIKSIKISLKKLKSTPLIRRIQRHPLADQQALYSI